MALGLRAKTPCCGRPVRLAVGADAPGLRERYERTCGGCGARWTITRRLAAERPGVRADVVEWERK